MDPVPIPPSVSDLERRRLESTIDNDLHSLSLTSIPTSSSTSATSIGRDHFQPHAHSHSHSHSFISSSSSDITLEYPRAEILPSSNHYHQHQHQPPYPQMGSGMEDTPRASYPRLPSVSGRMSSFGAVGAGVGGGTLGEQSMFIGASPVSTAGHHASAVTLGAGVFGKGGRDDSAMNGTEFDPERSLGRLVGELGRVMGSERLPARPTSPFSPPRSPSPLPSMHNTQAHNLSFTLTRNDPLLSPPSSGGESSHNQTQTQARYDGAKARPNAPTSNGNSRFSSLARELGDDLRAARQAPAKPQQTRRALSDSTSYNVNVNGQTPVARQQKEKVTGRVRALQDESRRSASVPLPSRGMIDNSMDVTGMTALLATPAKGGEFDTLGKNGEVGGNAGGNIAQTLATLHARLRALETENSVSRRRVRELEDELEKARTEVESAKQDGGKRLRDVIGEKSALEDLVQSLRAHLARLTVEVEQNKALIAELRTQSTSPRRNTAVAPGSPSVKAELGALRRQIERLTKEVERLGGIVEEGLETRKKSRGERTMRMEKEEMEKLVRQVMQEENDEEIARVRKDMERRNQRAQTQSQSQPRQAKEVTIVEPSKLRQGLHAAASDSPTLAPPTVQPVRVAPPMQRPTPPPSDDDGESCDSPTPASRSLSGSRQSVHSLIPDLGKGANSKPKSKSPRLSHNHNNSTGPSSAFPSIIGDELEAEFFSPSRKFASAPARAQGQAQERGDSARTRNFVNAQAEIRSKGVPESSGKPGSGRRSADGQELPPQTVLARVVVELEDDFAHYKAIYAELADQYKLLDPASVSAKRHVLADHLREVIDTLEQKADQIGDLYDLLSFSDRPATDSRPTRANGGGQEKTTTAARSVGDVLRMVRESLGEEVWERLESDLGWRGNGNGNERRRRSGGREV